MEELFKRSLGEPCGRAAGCFFLLVRVGLVGGVPTGTISLGCMDRVRFCSSYSSAVAPLEVAHFLLLDFLGAVGVDLLGRLLGEQLEPIFLKLSAH